MFIRGRTSEYLLVINTIIFTIAIIGLLVFGFKSSGISLIFYSIWSYIRILGINWWNGFPLWCCALLKGKEWYYYPADSYRERNCFFTHPVLCQPPDV